MDAKDKEITKLKHENALLRQLIADTNNHYVADLQIQMELAVSNWTRQLKDRNRACLRALISTE